MDEKKVKTEKKTLLTSEEIARKLLMKNPEDITLREIVEYAFAQMRETGSCTGGFEFSPNGYLFSLRIHLEHDEEGRPLLYKVDPKNLN